MVWSQLFPDKTHVAFACIGFFTLFFSVVSTFIKEKAFFGEAPISALYGLIIGPHCLNWVNPFSWGNFLYITLEVSRILLCVELVAVGIELPPKYVFKHSLSILLLLSFAMIIGWLVFAAFVYLIFPDYSYAWGLLISACVTATDPVLAQAIIGKSKFAAERVPTHLKQLLTAESACNDGLAVPFVYLALNIIVHAHHSKDIAKNFIVVTVLYECVFGCLFGALTGYCASWLVRLAKKYNLMDRESNIFFPFTIAFWCAGFSSILGIDDLLASFCAGCAYVWDDWLERKEEEETFIDSLDVFLNISYFIYFGTIIPWSQFNNVALGLNVWRLILLSIVFLTLRRFPAVLMHYKINPDIHSLKEAIFVGHFGPIGVSGLFACILAISDLESVSLGLAHGPVEGEIPLDDKFAELIDTVYPIVTFLIIVSIIVHGSSAAFIVFTSHLKKRLPESKTFRIQNTKSLTTDVETVNSQNFDTSSIISDELIVKKSVKKPSKSHNKNTVTNATHLKYQIENTPDSNIIRTTSHKTVDSDNDSQNS